MHSAAIRRLAESERRKFSFDNSCLRMSNNPSKIETIMIKQEPVSHSRVGGNLKKIVVLFIGKPGAGKGTQADILRDKYGLAHFNTGDVIRHRVANPKTPDDQHEKEIYASGKLNTFTWVARLVKEAAHEFAQAGQGIVFSGSPRSLYEAQELVPQLLEDYGQDKVLAIILDIDDDLAVKRNGGRLTCDSCGAALTPSAEDLESILSSPCLKCGGKMIRRAIDNPEAIKTKRLPEYQTNTIPAIDYMRHLGIVREVDGRQSISKVAQEVELILAPFLK